MKRSARSLFSHLKSFLIAVFAVAVLIVFRDEPGHEDVCFTAVGLEVRVIFVLLLEHGHAADKSEKQSDHNRREDGNEA